jgi:tape measure domain-containing protein
MANSEATEVKILVSAEDGASPALESVNKNLSELGEAGKTAEDDLLDLEKGLKKLGTDLTEIETGISRFERATINTFKEIADNSQSSGKQISAAFDKAFDNIKSPVGIKQLESELKRLQVAGELTEEEFKKLSERFQDTGEAAQETVPRTDQLVESLGEISEAAEALGGEGGSLGTVGDILTQLKNPAVLAAGAIAGLAAAYVEINRESDNVKSSLLTVLGSQEAVTEAMSYASDVANRLGADVNQTAEAWVDFDNGMKALGQTGEQSQRLFEALSYAIVSTGGTMEDVKDDAIEMFNEALTEGTINGEAMQEMLRGKMAPAFEAMAKAAGVSNDELGQMLNDGMETADMLLLLQKGLDGAFGDPKYIEGFDNGLQRIKNSIATLMTTDTGNSALATGFDKIAGAITQLSKYIDITKADFTNLFEVFAAFGKFDFSAPLDSMKEVNKALNEATANRNADLKAIEEKYNHLSVASMAEGQKAADAAHKAIDADKQRELGLKAIEEQYGTLGLTSIRTLTKTGDDLLKYYERIKKSGTETAESIDTAFLKMAEGQIAAANAAGKPVPEFIRQEAAARGLSDAVDKLVEDTKQLSPEMEALAEKQKKVNQIFEDAIAHYDKEAASKRSVLEGERDLAAMKGNTYQVYQKNIQIAELDLETAQRRLSLMTSESNQIQAEIAAQITLANADGELTVAENEVIVALQQKALALAQTSNEAKAQIPILEENVKTAKHQASQAKENTQATQENTGATEENTEGKKKASSSGGSLAAVIGSLIDYWRQETRSLSAATEALFLYNAGMSKVSKPESITHISEEADKATVEIKQLTAGIGAMTAQMQVSTGSVGYYMDMVNRAGMMAKRSYYEQKLDAESLNASIVKLTKEGASGFVNVETAMYSLSHTTQNAINSFDLLNEQDLAKLQDSLDAATQKLREMQQETDAATRRLSELNAEILREKGLDAQADALENQIKKTEDLKQLELELQKAKSEGNRELVGIYEEQKQKLEELYSLKERNRQADERQRIAEKNASDAEDRRNADKQRTGNTGSGGGSSGGSGISNSGQTIRLEGPSGKTFDFQHSGIDINELVRELRKAGLTVAA